MKFGLGEVLSITTGRLVSETGMDGVYNILNFLTGDDLYTHQLPRAADECCPWILDRYPQLENVVVGEINESNWKTWLAEQVTKFGAEIELDPIPAAYHEIIDPVEEAKQMTEDFEETHIFVVNLSDDENIPEE